MKTKKIFVIDVYELIQTTINLKSQCILILAIVINVECFKLDLAVEIML